MFTGRFEFPRAHSPLLCGGVSEQNTGIPIGNRRFLAASREELQSGSALISFEGCAVYCALDNTRVYFWGNVYNLKELGFDAGQSLAEFLYGLYREKGVSCFGRVDGSFTCIVEKPDELLIVRDHHGTSHQVYYDNTHFASSLLLLVKHKGFEEKPDLKALCAFLSVGYIATPETALVGVRKLGAGEALCYKSGKQYITKLFETKNIRPSDSKAKLEDLSDEYGWLHADAIRRRIEGQSSVGILLSGGYDSGCNLVALRNQYAGDIHSFSIGFKGDNWSELPLAKCMSDTFNTIHTTYEIDGSEIAALPDIIRHLGDPFVEGGLMVNYAVMRLAADNRQAVLLGGDGSDQYFGTTGREIAMHLLLRKYGLKPVAQLVNNLLSRPAFDKDSRLYKVKFHTDKILHILEGDLFGFPDFLLTDMVQDRSFLPFRDKRQLCTGSFEELYTQHAYQTDLEKTINQVILFKASQLAAMFGNQMAFPYLDLTLYDFLQKLPVAFKCKGNSLTDIAKGYGTAKFLLKYHYKPQLPEEITSKKKQGGFAPMPLFFADKQRRDTIGATILDSAICTDFLKKGKVEQFIKRYNAEAIQPTSWFWYCQNKAIQFFNLYTLALWWDCFIDHK